MARVITSRRIYNLGQYQSLEFTDSIEIKKDDVPEKIIDKVRMLQLLSMEKNMRMYSSITSDLENREVSDAIQSINENRLRLEDELRTNGII